mgnify:CR=1 FL=1
MPAEQLDEVVDRVAEIIRRVGKREEIEEEVAGNVSFSDLANTLIDQEGPVREAAVKVVTSVLKNLEIESGSDEETQIIDGIDFNSFSTKLVDDPEISAALKSSIKSVIENCESDEFTQAVESAFGLDDSDRLTNILGEKVKGDLDKVVVDKIRTCVESWDTSDLDGDTVTGIEKAVFTPERIVSCLSGHDREITEAVTACALVVIEAANPTDGDGVVTQTILESDAFKTAISTVLEQMVRSGKIDQLVEKTITSMLSSEDSTLRTKISSAVSDKLVGQIADSVVSRLFERSR